MTENNETEENINVSDDVREETNIQDRRNALINELQNKILTKKQMILGSSGSRNKHAVESQYQAVIDEINELGKKLDLAPVSLGSLRK